MTDVETTQESLQAQIEALQAKLRDQAAAAETDQPTTPKATAIAETAPKPTTVVVATQASDGLQTGASASEPALTPDQIAKRAEPGFNLVLQTYQEYVAEIFYEFLRADGFFPFGAKSVRPFITQVNDKCFALGNPDNPTEIVEAEDDPSKFESLRSAMQGVKKTFAAFGLNIEEFKVVFEGNGAAALKVHEDTWLVYTIDWRAPTQMNIDHVTYRWTQFVSTKPSNSLPKAIETLLSASRNYYRVLNLKKQELEEQYDLALPQH